MQDVDKVAKAIHSAMYIEHSGSWEDLSEDERWPFRRMAAAAIEALDPTPTRGLHE